MLVEVEAIPNRKPRVPHSSLRCRASPRRHHVDHVVFPRRCDKKATRPGQFRLEASSFAFDLHLFLRHAPYHLQFVHNWKKVIESSLYPLVFKLQNRLWPLTATSEESTWWHSCAWLAFCNASQPDHLLPTLWLRTKHWELNLWDHPGNGSVSGHFRLMFRRSNKLHQQLNLPRRRYPAIRSRPIGLSMLQSAICQLI